MLIIIARAHPVHNMNVKWRQPTVDLQTKPTNMGCKSTYGLLS